MTTRRGGTRVVGGLLLFSVLEIVFVAVDFEPRPLRLGLLVALCVAVASLIQDSLGDSGPAWSAHPVRLVSPPGSDARLAAYVRLIESHLTAATPDNLLCDRLARLCDERLERCHRLRRSDPAAEPLLGTALLQDLAGPPRRLSLARIDDHLRRIEEL